MKIDLEVLASTNIKRKKPWPKIIWIGEEQESLLLLDSHGKRISVLYVPSGKTKRKLTKLSPIAEQLYHVTRTQNGRFLVGVLLNGEIFVWHKDKDIIKFISGLSKLHPDFNQEQCHVVLSDDCNHLLVAIGNQNFYLWEMEKGESAMRDHSDEGMKGGWHKITVPEGITLPTSGSRECTVAGVYYESPMLGHCIHLSVVYNRAEVLSIATLVMKFPDPAESFGKNLPIFTAEWSLLEYPFVQMHPKFEAINSPGAYISKYSSNGQVLAIAANQRSPTQTAMLFVSPLTDTVLVGDMRKCGVTDSNKIGRHYWVSDIAWTCDSLFLACILKNGSVCLIPRLGEPCVIQSRGYSVDMGPSYYLPLHPAIFVSDNQGSLEPSAMEQDPLQQKFSLATHPSLPIILFSDGFLVTVVQLPVEMTPVTLMRDLVISSAKQLKKVYEQENLDMTVADAYKLSKGKKQTQPEVRKQRRPYEFEMAEITLNSTLDSETSMIETSNKFGFDQFGAIGNMDSGKIVFGEPEMIMIDPNATFSGLDASDALLRYLERSMADLTQAWKLAVSHADIWTAEVDNIAKQTVHNLSKIFSIILDCPAVEAIIPVLTPRQSSAIQNTRVYNVIVAYRNILQLLRFDTYNQHLLPATLRLVHKTITLMLSSRELETTDPKLKTLFGSYSLLKHAETSLNRTYVWVPTQTEGSIPSGGGSPRRFEPAVKVRVERQSTGSDGTVSGVRLDQQGQLPGKRLATTWKFLYKHVVDYQSKVSATGDPKGELPHVEKLMFTIQQTLQEADINITPRKASAKLSSVWLRNTFPFELLSESDSFLYSDEYSDDTIQSSPEPRTSLSPSTNTSSPFSVKNSSRGSHTSSSSPNEFKIVIRSDPSTNQNSRNQESPTPIGQQSAVMTTIDGTHDNAKKSTDPGQIAKSPPPMDMKITAYSSSSSSPNSASASPDKPIGHSPSRSKFNLFSKLKTAVKGRKPDPNETGSGIQVESYTSSDKGQSSSMSSFFGSKKSTPRVLSYSSSLSPKESNNSTLKAGLQTTLQVIDIIKVGDDDCKKEELHEAFEREKELLKSEGFEVQEYTGTSDYEMSKPPKSEKHFMGVVHKQKYISSDALKSTKASVDKQKYIATEELIKHSSNEELNELEGGSVGPLTKGTVVPVTKVTVSAGAENESGKTNRNSDQESKFRFNSEKHSVDGEHTMAIEAWKQQLRLLTGNKKDSPKTARMLHSVLYTHLLKDELSQAVDFIDSLILQASIDGALNSQELPAYEDGSRPPLMTLVSHRSQDSEQEELVPCVKNKSIRQTVQTMARYMASYFSNKTMFIYPPHSAQALPSVHMSDVPTKSRIVPKYHEDVTQIITREGLSELWTTYRCVEYLLMSGLICETAWFASKMGDWKTAFLLSVAHTGHREIAPQLYRKAKKPLQLPMELSPHSILQEKLEILIRNNKAGSTPGVSKHSRRYFIPINQETNISQLTKTLTEMLTAGIMCDVELSPWLLSNLTEKLKSVVSNLPPLVPDEFYLPSPPLYCPQPGEEETDQANPDVQYERELRMEISSIIQMILVSLNSAHLTLPVARWYIQELFKVQDRAKQFKATTEGPSLELPQILQQYKILRSDIIEYREDGHVSQVMASFRDFCTILWVLHVRDELSLKLRKRGSQLTNANKDGVESPESTLGQEYVQDCFRTLKWAVNMLNFTQYIADDGCIHKVVLSLILELPKTEDTADILAEHFYDVESFDAEIQEKLERLVSSWHSIEILPEDDGKSARLDDESDDVKRSIDDNGDDDDDGSVRKSVTFYQASPRAKTLSVYFHKQCAVVKKVMQKKRKLFGTYEEFVFQPDGDGEERFQSSSNGGMVNGINIGSRPFETKQSYIEFLDRFYAICFTKVVERESEAGPTTLYPVLMPFARLIRETEFQKFLSKQDETYQKRQSSVVLSSPRAKFYRSQSESRVDQGGYDAKPSPVTGARRSLFRSNSSGDGLQGRNPAGMSKYTSESSLLGRNGAPGSLPRGKGNMTGMASRFFQSEDVLYRDPGDSQEAHWILDVNFGQRYLALQQLLDYLQHWCNKQHSLGLHGKSDKDLGLKPTMRIEVPTQLVVLGLWLLDHKYSSQKHRRQQEEASNPEPVEEDLHVSVRTKMNNLATVEEMTEHDSFTQVSNIVRSRSLSTGKPRSRSHSPRARSTGNMSGNRTTLESGRSFTSTQEETEQIQSAYKKVLDGGDDSSSLEVSSLEPDDYEEDMKHTLSVIGKILKPTLSDIGSDKLGRGRSSRRRKTQRNVGDSPDSRSNSAFNNTMGFAASPERASKSYIPPQTSTPVRNRSPAVGRQKNDIEHHDLSRISVTHIDGVNTAPPAHYRGGLLGGNPGQSVPPGDLVPVQQESTQQGMMGMDMAQQLQHIVRGELRRMMEVQHRSMMAMMGALDGQPPGAYQQQPSVNIPLSQPSMGNNQVDNPGLGSSRRKKHAGDVLKELKNLQREEDRQKPKRSAKHAGKENIVDSTLRVSALQDNVEVYRITQDPNQISMAPRFLKMEAERDNNVRFPGIPQEAWASQDGNRKFEDVQDLPLLHVERTVPGQIFPGAQRRQTLPQYQQPAPGFFQPPSHVGGPSHGPGRPMKSAESVDSGIGIPLLRLPSGDEPVRRQPKFGELLPPEYVMENYKELHQQEEAKQRYMKEFHNLQAEKAEGLYKQRFGENLLRFPLKSEQSVEEDVQQNRYQATSPRKSPRKTPRSLSEQISSKKEKSKQTPRTPRSISTKKDKEEEEEKEDEGEAAPESTSKSQPIKEEDSGEEAESEDEDATEAESLEEGEEELHDGYAFKQGEFEAYLALEKQLAKTKDTHARIQLKTALRLQQQRMTENWRKAERRKVDFSTNTTEYIDAVTEADADIENIRTSEKATSITKDTGVDPIQEAVIEYNKSRQPNVLPPDIYMGLRFNDAGTQPSSSVTGHQQDSRGRSYLNVVDVDAAAILRDLKDPSEQEEPRLDVPIAETQQHIRRRIALEEESRATLVPPVIERPTRADELTIRMFETRAQGEDRVSLAVMPRESMSESKYAIMQRLRDMNTQLAAIDRMSNNMEREFKSTRLALHTLDEMTHAMEPPTAQELEDIEEQEIPEKPYESQSGSQSLSPQSSTKSPTQSIRATARSAKSTKEQQQLSTELARMSGLSGISDIIGDMVAQGDIDLHDVGLSAREAERLVQRGAIRKDQAEEARVSLNDIKQCVQTAKHVPGSYDKETLHQWMATKKQERMDQYKQQVEELREREARPFRPKATDLDQSLSVKERKAMEDSRKASSKMYMNRRLGEARELLGDILTEKPDLPKDLPPRTATFSTPKQRKSAKDRSPARGGRTPIMPQTFKKDRSPIRKPAGILRRDTSPPSAYNYYYDQQDYPEDTFDDYDDYRDNDAWMYEEVHDGKVEVLPEPKPKQIVVQPRDESRKTDFASPKPVGKKQPGLVPKLKLGLGDVEEEPALQQTAETTGDLSEYYRAVEAMDHDITLSQSYERSRDFTKQPAENEPVPSPQKTFKVKPYNEIVRVQRPHVTRKRPNKFAIETAARLKTVSQSETSRTSARTELTQRERMMIHGSKRLPSKTPTESGPRRVKTYTERLQEMKSEEKYSTPVAPKSHYGSSIASTTARPMARVIKPKHKPVTYVEQLQKLNAGHHKPKLGTTTVIQKTMVKSHKPPHKPKTYAEQLQDLQPHKPGPQKKRVQKTSPASRQRPYKDPYASASGQPDDQWDRESMVSAWSMGSDVRHALYDDVESSIAVGQSASYAPSEQASDYFDAVMGDDYTASVDIDDLVRIADDGTSLSGGSVMSYIDWDEVDDLIADIH